MAKTEMIRARVEPVLKNDAETVFSTLGLSPTEAITLFYKQVTLQHGLPFEVRIPNVETVEAMRQVRVGDGLVEYVSLDDLKANAMNKPLIDNNGEANELGDNFFKKARRGRPPLPEDSRKQRVTLYLDPDLLEFFKRAGKGWQTRINAALQDYRSEH